METWIIERAQQAITRMLIDRFERRPYSRVAITSPWREDEPRLSVEARKLERQFEQPATAMPLEQCGITISLTTATDHEGRGMNSLLEVVSFLHEADIAAEDIVIVGCAFRAARLERDLARERSRCLADFAVTLLRD